MANHNPPTSASQSDRRATMAEFSAAELLAEVAERGGVFGHLADLLGQARVKAERDTDPHRRMGHSVIFWHLYHTLQRMASR